MWDTYGREKKQMHDMKGMNKNVKQIERWDVRVHFLTPFLRETEPRRPLVLVGMLSPLI